METGRNWYCSAYPLLARLRAAIQLFANKAGDIAEFPDDDEEEDEDEDEDEDGDAEEPEDC